MKKQVPRTNDVFKPKQDNPIYSPNFEFIKSSLGLVGPKFGKLEGRKEHKNMLNNSDFYKINEKCREKNKNTLSFQKQEGR